jgi:hypothetical protein
MLKRKMVYISDAQPFSSMASTLPCLVGFENLESSIFLGQCYFHTIGVKILNFGLILNTKT